MDVGMTQNYHTAIATGAAANASTFNTALGALDSGLTDTSTIASATAGEVATARSGYGTLGSRLDNMTLAGSNVSTQANGAANAGQTVITVDSTTGFLPGARIEYTLVGGVVETNTVDTVDSPTQLTCTGNLGTGGIANNGYVGVISLSALSSSGAVTGAISAAQTLQKGATLGTRTASGDDSAMIIARAVGDTINSHGVRDESVLTAGSAATGYAAVDAQYTAGGTANYNHIAGFQARQIYNGSGTLSEWRGFWSNPNIQGPTTDAKHINVQDAVTSGSGALTNQYGIFIDALDAASGTNYAIYTYPSTPSLFGGKINVLVSLNENGSGVADGHLRLAALGGSNQLMIGWNNTGFYGWLQAAKFDAAAYAPLLLNPNGGNVGVGVLSTAGKLHVDQSSTTGAIPALALDQADESEGFIDFLGTAAASAVGPISTWTTGATLTGFVRVEINGAAYWMPYYTAPSS